MGCEDQRTIRGRYTKSGLWIPGWVEVKCCGHWMRCDGFTSTCEFCGADYNWSGDQLAARALWDGTDGAGSPGYE